MNELERYKLVKFCAMATANINNVEVENIEEQRFFELSDEELIRESGWLDDLLNK